MAVKLLHIYKHGRFGPEKQLGFIYTDNPGCIKAAANTGFDIVHSTSINPEFWTNPLGISNLREYRKYKRMAK